MDGRAAWRPDMLSPLKLCLLFRRGAVGNLRHAERQPATFVPIAVQILVELKIGDWVKHCKKAAQGGHR